jgi:acyl-CoA thioesterase FadM
MTREDNTVAAAEPSFQFRIAPRFTDLDTWRHVNNSAIYQFHIEARMQAYLDRFGGDAWYSDTVWLRPVRTMTHYQRVTHYGADVECHVRLLAKATDSYRVRTELFQHGHQVGVQECVMGAFDHRGRQPLPAAMLAGLGAPQSGALEPEPPSPVADAPETLDGYPIHRSLTARYADLDVDQLRAERASARYMEQARFGTIGKLDFGGLGILIAALDMSFHDHRPAVGAVTLATGVSRVGNSSFNVMTTAMSELGVHTTADSVMVMIDQSSGRPTPIPDSLRAQLREMMVSGR